MLNLRKPRAALNAVIFLVISAPDTLNILLFCRFCVKIPSHRSPSSSILTGFQLLARPQKLAAIFDCSDVINEDISST